MRVCIIFAMFVTACTANVTIYKVPLAQRVADACTELDTMCTATGNCVAQQTFCGADAQLFTGLFVAEDSCKSSCNEDTSCLKACKVVRVTAIDTYLANGAGSAACSTLSSTCSTSGQGCTAGEFFCVAQAPAPSPCANELDTCKAACIPHDRTCLRACRATYRQCLAGTSTTDAGVPDAPMMPDAAVPDAAVPDAPTTTTTTYNLTYGTTAGSTGTGTVTVSPAGASCGAMCATYASGTTVTLTATPSTGSTFTKWVGCTSTTNKCTVTMTMAMTVTATFTKTTTTTSYTYTTDIAPKMAGLCSGCHSGNPPGNYFTDSYTGLFGNGSDTTPNVIAGDANSLFLQKIAGNHHNVLSLYPGFDKVSHDWVVLNNAVK